MAYHITNAATALGIEIREGIVRADGVYQHIQDNIRNRPELAKGSGLILDESADEKSGIESAGAPV